MRFSGRACRLLAAALALGPLLCAAAPATNDTAGIEFFESKIRPLLTDHCYKCHSHRSEKVRGGFMLDTRDDLRQGGDSGPAIVPGHPEKSLLIHAVSYTDKDLQMPPKDQKLADDEIENLRAWIKMGAPDPRVSGATATPAIAWAAARKHWAFQPVVEPPLPKIHRHKSWIQSPVDAFVLENLNAKHLKPSPPADRRILIRRATFDLTGLPPTPDEVEAFLADKSKDAFAKVVDRLLDSPRYGERWGRYWLDVARYADRSDSGNFQNNAIMPYAYTYRDYVIRAFNEDLPYNRFIVEQIAADQLPAHPKDNCSLAAMGFLTIGRKFFGNQNDVIDDRIDVVTRGLLGLTVSCARCHDHKFDPIPTRDYYALHGIFNSSVEPTNLPLLTVPLPPRYTNYLEDVRTNEEALKDYIASNDLVVLDKVRSATGDYLLAVHDAAPFATNNLNVEDLLRSRKLNKSVYLSWKTNLANIEKTNRLFAPWRVYSSVHDYEWTGMKPGSFGPGLNPLVARAFNGMVPTNLAQVAAIYDKLFGQIPDPATNEAARELKEFVEAANSPANPPRESFERVFLFDNTVIATIRRLRYKLVEVDATDPGAPPRAMVLRDRSQAADSRIFLRGNPGTPGAVAPRRFLEILDGPEAAPFPKKSSGRLQLAEAIASPDNPLTARVFVNRVWMHHFGAPLVSTPSDFGVRTPKPLQAKLLDYLAARFMADGWSVKKLHRLIMLSSVYQQSSDDNPSEARVDPDNDYLWRMNPQRLDFEAMRDSFLFVAGQLDETMDGQPVNIAANTMPARRTVYGLVDRQNLPGFFRTFDFANPDTSSAERFETVVASQALYLLNGPLLSECAHGVVEQCPPSSAPEDLRIRRLYEILFQRRPTPAEMELGQNYLANQPVRDAVVPEMAAWQYGWGAFDEQAGRMTDFNPLPYFTNATWRASLKGHGAKSDPVQLTAYGGYSGRAGGVAAVRRWTAARDGIISISGDLSYKVGSGNGVRGRIVSSRVGLLGQWDAHNGHAAVALENIEVKKGDTIDFAVESLSPNQPEAFHWAPVITMAKAASEEIGLPHVWNAKEDFLDPKKTREPMGAWEKYAQVLLFSNEFFFVE